MTLPLQPALERIAANLPAGKLGVYVKELSSGQEWSIRGDERFPTASVVKVPVLVEFFRQWREGLLRLDERMELTDERRCPGSGILNDFDSGLRLTLHDLALVMVTHSDNTATDMILERIGVENADQAMKRLGLTQTTVRFNIRTMLYNGFGVAGPEKPGTPEMHEEYLQRIGAGERDEQALVYSDSLENCVSTPREMGILLEYILKGEAFDGPAGERMMAILTKNRIKNRLPRLLPPDAVVAHKTGTYWGTLNNAGIIFCPKGPVIVSCFTKEGGDRSGENADALADIGKLVWDHFS